MPTTSPSTIVTALVALAIAAASFIGIALTPYTGPTTITSCQTIRDKTFSTGLDIRATNGNHGPYATEADALAGACVKLIDVVIAPNSMGNGDAGIDDLYPGAGGACVSSGGQCGSVYIADSEIRIKAAASGYTYGVKYGNISMWRTTVHGGPTGISCNGYCDIHDSFLGADTSDGSGATHMDGFISNGNGGRGIVLDHNILSCDELHGSYGNGAGCSAPIGLFGDFDPLDNITVTNNYFSHTTSGHWCSYTGASQPSKVHTTGTNIKWEDNFYDAATCKHGGSGGGLGQIADWANNSGNVLCGNINTDGTTTGFPTQTTSCPAGKAIPTLPALPGVGSGTTTTAPATTTTITPVTTTTTVPRTTTTVTVPKTTTTVTLPVTTTTTVPPTTTTVTLPPTTTTTVDPRVAYLCEYDPRDGTFVCSRS